MYTSSYAKIRETHAYRQVEEFNDQNKLAIILEVKQPYNQFVYKALYRISNYSTDFVMNNQKMFTYPII